MVSDLRSKTRRLARNEIAEVGLALFAKFGYDETTVDAIAEAAGLSKRNFFRYFTNKEEVVTSGFEAFGQRLADFIGDRPPNEEPWQATIGAYREFTDIISPEEHVGRLQLTRSTPSLRGAVAGISRSWRIMATEALRDRYANLTTLEADVIAGSVNGAWLAAIDEWLPQHDDADIDVIVEQAFAILLNTPSVLETPRD